MMKIRANNAIIATLKINMEMLARQKVMNRFLLTALSTNEHEVSLSIAQTEKQVLDELELIRAIVYQVSEVDPNDLMNGLFDV